MVEAHDFFFACVCQNYSVSIFPSSTCVAHGAMEVISLRVKQVILSCIVGEARMVLFSSAEPSAKSDIF